MTDNCIVSARLFVAFVVLVWALSLRVLYRRMSHTPAPTKRALRWGRLLFWSTAALTGYGIGELLIADPAQLPSFVPPNVAACVAETWSARWIAMGCLMMLLMYVGLTPFIAQRPEEADHSSPRAPAIGGLFLGFVCLGVLSQFLLPFVVSLFIVAMVVSILTLLASRPRKSLKIQRTQRGLVATLGVMWPTVIMPVASSFTLTVAILVFVVSLAVLYKTVVEKPHGSLD